MQTLEEAIVYVETVARANESLVSNYESDKIRAKIHRQLAAYLRELQERRKAPEIVRCKDCAYYDWDCVDAPYGMTKTICWCDLHYDAGNENLVANPDDYCKWAERRTDD